MEILRLKEILVRKGISREFLAEKVGVSVTTISNISTNKNMPTIHLLLDIAKVCDVDVRELLIPTKGHSVTQEDVNNAMELIEKGLNILEGVKKVPLKTNRKH
jgi:transcriptional regulator with XRE-family HTH domain